MFESNGAAGIVVDWVAGFADEDRIGFVGVRRGLFVYFSNVAVAAAVEPVGRAQVARSREAAHVAVHKSIAQASSQCENFRRIFKWRTRQAHVFTGVSARVRSIRSSRSAFLFLRSVRLASSSSDGGGVGGGKRFCLTRTRNLAGVAGDSREHGLDDERSDEGRVAMARSTTSSTNSK